MWELQQRFFGEEYTGLRSEDFIVRPSGIIECRKDNPYMILIADALTDGSLSVKVKSNEYTLDGTEETRRRFEKETGMDAGELLEAVQIIRRQFRAGLNVISEAEYQKVCGRITAVAKRLAVMWGFYTLICCLVYLPDKLREKKVDEDMKHF